MPSLSLGLRNLVLLRLHMLFFSAINWFEATAWLLTLGAWCPNWAIRYAAWFTIKFVKIK
jgi:hypothetical protein